jgi:hypothetical protein
MKREPISEFFVSFQTSVADPDPDPPDPHDFGPPGSGSGSTGQRYGIRILLSSCKNSKKNLDSYYFVTIFDILSYKNDVNVQSKSNYQKKLC